jgi:heat shock protein HslJ
MKRISQFLIVVLSVGGLLLASCSNTSQLTLAGTSWSLLSYTSGATITPAAAGVDTHVEFSTDGQVSGSLGCNSFSGEYNQKSGSITFGSMLSTMMACDEPRMTQESAGFRVLTGQTQFMIEGDILTIQSTDGSSTLVLQRK